MDEKEDGEWEGEAGGQRGGETGSRLPRGCSPRGAGTWGACDVFGWACLHSPGCGTEWQKENTPPQKHKSTSETPSCAVMMSSRAAASACTFLWEGGRARLAPGLGAKVGRPRPRQEPDGSLGSYLCAAQGQVLPRLLSTLDFISEGGRCLLCTHTGQGQHVRGPRSRLALPSVLRAERGLKHAGRGSG